MATQRNARYIGHGSDLPWHTHIHMMKTLTCRLWPSGAVSTCWLTRYWHGNGMEVLDRYRHLDWSKVIHMCITWSSIPTLSNWNLYKLKMLTYKHRFHVQRLIISNNFLNQHNVMDPRCCLLYIHMVQSQPLPDAIESFPRDATAPV